MRAASLDAVGDDKYLLASGDIPELGLAEVLLEHRALALGLVLGRIDAIEFEPAAVVGEDLPGAGRAVEPAYVLEAHVGGGQRQRDQTAGTGARIEIDPLSQAGLVVISECRIDTHQELRGGRPAYAAAIQ